MISTSRKWRRNWRPFEEAREFAHGLKFSSACQWQDWAKTAAKPDDIPAKPDQRYTHEWVSWGDWLGTDNRSFRKIVYRSFEEARHFARKLGFKCSNDWRNWCRTKERPSDIHSNPRQYYQNKGWVSWSDFLDYASPKQWNRFSVLSFLRDLGPILADLQPTELFAIMRQNGMLDSMRNGGRAKDIKSILDLCSSSDRKADLEKLIAEVIGSGPTSDSGLLDDLGEDGASLPEFAAEVIPGEAGEEPADKEALPLLPSLATLKAVDKLVEAKAVAASDEETIEFLLSNRVSGYWQRALDEGAHIVDSLRTESGGVYFSEIQKRFLRQYDGATNLLIPDGYTFHVNGVPTLPNLMQRLTAYRVLTERRVGNWSGVGAGKTLSAILASRVIGARLTMIVAFNSTIEAWAKTVKAVYPDSAVLVKQRGDIAPDPARHTYLILNFETFQQGGAATWVRRLVQEHKIDFVVLDEIQSVKQRTSNVTSRRRQVVTGLLSAASEKNPDLCVLGMSATPVINNLHEGRALLEMICGETFGDLKTFSSIANASALHEKLILRGIRYRPRYTQSVETTPLDIAGDDYLPLLIKATKRHGPLGIERILLDAKSDAILGALRPGTLVYTHYLDGLVGPLQQMIEQAGFSVGLYTGDDKAGLSRFLDGKVDVLVGSRPVGTGVDGLQRVCNRLIMVSLPWTSADYEQIIGRLHRQGSNYGKVEVVIPQVVLARGDATWSWDKMRWNRIQYKRTLADAALDGVIPEGELASETVWQAKAREALDVWIARVEQNGVALSDRTKLSVPLLDETERVALGRFGDLSTMNARWNNANSHVTHERLTQDPEEWYLYHTLFRSARQTWPEIPCEKIARSLARMPSWIVGDFGCGEASLAACLPNPVYSFDHVAVSDAVFACDMGCTPLSDEMLDVAVFSLSLMGRNYEDYLREAYRVLKFGGHLKIAEPLSRWKDVEVLLGKVQAAGFSVIGRPEEAQQFIYVNAIKMPV